MKVISRKSIRYLFGSPYGHITLILFAAMSLFLFVYNAILGYGVLDSLSSAVIGFAALILIALSWFTVKEG